MAGWDLWQAEGTGGVEMGTPMAAIPSEHAEPIAEMLDALAKGQALFVVSPETPEAADRLTLPYLQQCAASLPTCSDTPRVWPLLSDSFLVALPLDGPPDDPFNAVHIQSVRRLLLAQLQAASPSRETSLVRPPLTLLEGGLEPGPAKIDEHACSSDIPQAEEAPEGQQTEGLETEGTLLSLLSDAPSPIRVLPLARLGQTESIEHNVDELNALLEIIIKKQLHTQFQPIVSLRDGTVTGYEALIRGPKNAPLRRPGAMFRAADKAHLVAWFDLACQEHCFQVAARQNLKSLLFVNMDAEGLAYCDDAERSLAQRAREHGLTPARIVVEVTERQTVGDFPRLLRYLQGLREEGFKIAIDDAGAGYSSLNAIAEVRPDFVKLDKTLVRNLHRHGERRALLAALLAFTNRMGAALLAEGIEAEEELAVLLDMGVPYAQGYVLAKPADAFRGIPRPLRAFISERTQAREAAQQGQARTLGHLCVPGRTVPPDAPLASAAHAFAKNDGLTSVVVVEENCARGLLMRSQLQHVLAVTRASKIGDYLPTQTVEQWMTTSVLYAPAHASVGEIARQATARSDISLDSDVIVTGDANRYMGTIPIRLLLEAAMTG